MSAALPLIEKAGLGAAKAGAGLLKGGAHAAADVLKAGGGPGQLLQQLTAAQSAPSAPAGRPTPAPTMTAPAPTSIPSGAATDPADPSFGYKPGSPLFSGGVAAVPKGLLPARPVTVSQTAPDATPQRQPGLLSQAAAYGAGQERTGPSVAAQAASGANDARLAAIRNDPYAPAPMQGNMSLFGGRSLPGADLNQPDHHVRDRWLALLAGGPHGLLDEINRQQSSEALRWARLQG